MAKTLIAYCTLTGETGEVAGFIRDGLLSTGAEVLVANVALLSGEGNIFGFDAYVLGSPTYHGEMMQPMKSFLFLAGNQDLRGRIGASFGSCLWSGEAVDRIHDTMKNIFRMQMIGEPLKLKSPILGDGEQRARELGVEIGFALRHA